jgi:GT2 family glycosyltransferase
VTAHFLNARDAHLYRDGECAAQPGMRDESGAWVAPRRAPAPQPVTMNAAGRVSFTHLIPYSLAANLADAYNDAVRAAPGEWILFTDADSMMLVPDYGHLIEETIARNPGAGLITAVTNRIGARSQLSEHGLMAEPSLLRLREVALARRLKFGAVVKAIQPPVSGVFMLFRRDVWKRVGGFKGRGLLGVDWRFSRDVHEAGLPILRMEGLFVAHFYRLDAGQKSVKPVS